MSDLRAKLAQIFGKALAEGVLGELSPSHKVREKAEELRIAFDTAVDSLRLTFPDPLVRGLVSLMWRLIGNKMILSATFDVPTISFTMMGGPDKKPVAFVLCPPDWPDMLDKDPIYQMGGVVFCASQCCDFYNGKFQYQQGHTPDNMHDADVQKRAYAYEAHYLNVVKEIAPEYQLNDYQKKVVDGYPQGVLSLPENLVYESKPFEVGPKNPFWQQSISNAKDQARAN